ncbi:dihydrodipicolinate reductase [Sphingobium sufflavum]|uniref:NAD(P)H-dependent amine dehydrogenase family protein n=1 Tax=Sphingobium sufflavum TaxID=1129547 RepID=UPI001F381C89|nr:dihydrodipicolinate reductase [Sphingobium sufflavum]MCE7798866.1 dihydrodipicolinate reductase [Sphingobium sufflavum]
MVGTENGERDGRHTVVQWATGTVGAHSLKALIVHPRLELVGVHVHSQGKEGLDAGDLCGMPKTGVLATRQIDAVLALRPDCVLYMPEGCNYEELCQLLEAGINIITTRGELFNPRMMDPAVRARVQAACERGNASIHATGSSPGFITEALPIVLLSIQRRLDCLTIDEYADLAPACSPEMIFTVMGFGETPEAFAKRDMADMNECFAHSLGVLADAIGLPLDDVCFEHEIATATERQPIGDGFIEPGTVAGLRMTVSAVSGGRVALRFRTNWYCTRKLNVDWGQLRDHGWRLLMEGDAPMDIDIAFPIPAGQAEGTLPGYTAHRPINAIPNVCAAKAGIVTITDLPQVLPHLGL